MNNKFSFKRFGQFACAEFKANNKQFWMSLLTITIIMLVGYIFQYTVQDNIKSLAESFAFSGAVAMFGSFLFASIAFKKYFNRNKNIETIMIPVSKSEKFIYQYLLNVFFLPLLVIVGIFGCYILASLFLGLNIRFTSFDFIFTIAIGQVCNLSIFFLGSIVFRRNAFIFTCLSLGGLIVTIAIFAVATQDWAIWTWIRDAVAPLFEKWFVDCTVEQIKTLCLSFCSACSVIVTAIITLIAWKKFKNIQTSK